MQKWRLNSFSGAQEHKQTVDPNLIRLAEAYKTASQKLLPLPPARDGAQGEADDSATPAENEEDVLADLFGECSLDCTPTPIRTHPDHQRTWLTTSPAGFPWWVFPCLQELPPPPPTTTTPVIAE